MVVRRKKKSRKYRGKRTYGHGRHKQARGAGHRGGRGKAGGCKHKWTYLMVYEPDHFGKRGFTPPKEVRREIEAINLKEIEEKLERWLNEGIAERKGDVIEVYVERAGYNKVLGTGKLTKPLIIHAKYFSESAIKKIEEAGGKAVKVS